MGPWKVAAVALLSWLAALHPLPSAASSSSSSSSSSRPSQKDCDNFPNAYYDEAARKCCYRCPAGYRPKTECPLDLIHGCIKIPCQPGYYLNHRLATPQCSACVRCASERNIVEVSPCDSDSGRVCACRDGWFCRTTVSDSCLRCSKHRSCGAGYGVRDAGTAEKDTVCEECPPGTFSDEDSPSQPCRKHTNCTKLRKPMAGYGNATHDAQCADPMTTRPAERSTEGGESVAVEEASARGEWDFSLLGGLLFSGLALCTCFAVAVQRRRRRACRTWILPRKLKVLNQTKICAKAVPLVEEGGEGKAPGPDGDSLLEMEALAALEPVQGSGDSPPQCTNCIEKIYIMRADTVIVGSVSGAPPGEKDDAEREDPGEENAVVRYPEQETEPPSGSDVTTPVEEEWEFHYSGGKTLAV